MELVENSRLRVVPWCLGRLEDLVFVHVLDSFFSAVLCSWLYNVCLDPLLAPTDLVVLRVFLGFPGSLVSFTTQALDVI